MLNVLWSSELKSSFGKMFKYIAIRSQFSNIGFVMWHLWREEILRHMLQHVKVTRQVKGDYGLDLRTFQHLHHNLTADVSGTMEIWWWTANSFLSRQRYVIKSYIILWMSAISIKYEAPEISLKKMIKYDSTFFFYLFFPFFFYAADVKQWVFAIQNMTLWLWMEQLYKNNSFMMNKDSVEM